MDRAQKHLEFDVIRTNSRRRVFRRCEKRIGELSPAETKEECLRSLRRRLSARRIIDS
jgi:hypothetical protein